MKLTHGISIELGINSKGWPSLLIYRQKRGRLRAKVPEHLWDNWYHDDELKTAKWFGAKLDLMLGKWKFPEPKYWLRPDANAEEWGRTSWPASAWNSGDHWYVFDSRVPLPGLFVSMFVKIGKYTPGFYLGCKTYRVDQQSSQLKDKEGNFITCGGEPVYTWASKEEQGNCYICFSATLRSKMID